MTAAYSPPDATREQVEAWERGRTDRCAACGVERQHHDAGYEALHCSAFVEQPRRTAIADRIVAEAVNEGRVEAILRGASAKGAGCPSCAHEPINHDGNGCRVSGCGCKRTHSCSSCGEHGHRRGDRACPNYATADRWSGHRQRAVR